MYNGVSMIKLDPNRIYSQEMGAPIGIQHTGRGQVDTDLPGIHNGGTQSDSICDSQFEEISLSSGQSTPSTIYRVPRSSVTVTDKIESSPLLSDTKKGSDSDKKGETNTDTKCESNYFHVNNHSDCHNGAI